MRLFWLIRLCCLAVALQCLDSNAWAFKREARVPLSGRQQYHAASGAARFFEIRRVPKEKDREELVIEVKNVPLREGTVLVVYVGDEQIGKITLGKKHSGTLKLTSDSGQFVPPIDAGTSVYVKTIEGRVVLW